MNSDNSLFFMLIYWGHLQINDDEILYISVVLLIKFSHQIAIEVL